MPTKQTKWSHKGVTIRERVNTGGTISYRVEYPARVKGKRTLVQFKTKAEAEADIDLAIVDKENLGTAAFLLNASERELAAKAMQLLQPFNVDLVEAAKFYVSHARPPGGDITSSDLASRFLQGKETKKKLRARSVGDLRSRLGQFNETFGARLVKDIRADEIDGWIYSDAEQSDQTKLNHFRVLKNFFGYALKNGFIAADPMPKVERPRPDDKTPHVLTVKQCDALLKAAARRTDLELLPYVTLGMFCGIRSGELAKLTWAHVDLGQKHVTIPQEIAKKRRIRIVDIPANAVAWLRRFPSGTADIRPEGFDKRFRALVKEAKLTSWPSNGLRHTAGSMHYAMYQDSAKTCAMLGHKNDSVLFDHYRSLVKPADARKFYALRPVTPANVVKLAEVG